MKLKLKCSGCGKQTDSDKCEPFDGCSSDGILFKKQLCPKCVKDIVDKFLAHKKAKKEAEKETKECL